MRAFDRDPIRGGHYGQRSCEPRLKAEHMAAPTKPCDVKILLANSEPSTHGTMQPWAVRLFRSALRGKGARLTRRNGPARCADPGGRARARPPGGAPHPSCGEAMRGGSKPKEKGNRAERAIKQFLMARGFTCERMPLRGAAGGRFVGDLLRLQGKDHVVEVKARRRGFEALYSWLEGRDI